MTVTRDDALVLDTSDPLAPFRERYLVDPDGPIYLDGNSLGRPSRSVLAAIERVVQREWAEGLVTSWEHWIDLPRQAGDTIAPLIGAGAGETIVSDSTSVNLYKLAAAALDARPGRGVIVTDADNFPTDRYVLEGLARARGVELRVVEASTVEPLTADVLATAIDDAALVSSSVVSYRSGAIAEVAAINELAHSAGALTLWDLSHAVGSVPVDLVGTDSDLAIGCTYKYLGGGPGAPAFLWVHPNLQDTLTQPIWGWFGHDRQFAFEPEYRPAAGIDRFTVGTPPIVPVAAVAAAVADVAEAGIEAIHDKARRATDLIVEIVDDRLTPHGAEVASPRDASVRGSHVAVRHPEGHALSAWLRANGVIVDFRPPDVVRVAVAPLSTSYAEVWEGLDRMAKALETGGHRDASTDHRVT